MKTNRPVSFSLFVKKPALNPPTLFVTFNGYTLYDNSLLAINYVRTWGSYDGIEGNRKYES